MKRAIRKIRAEGELAYVPLTQGFEAVIDAEDLPLVDGFNWRSLVLRHKDGSIKTVYAVRTSARGIEPRPTILMHRVILNAPSDLVVDHKDGNGLNNRRSGPNEGNLRLADYSQNAHNMKLGQRNSSGLKGTHWCQRDKVWRSQISANGKCYVLGSFSTAEAAHQEYCKASARLHGEFSNTGHGPAVRRDRRDS